MESKNIVIKSCVSEVNHNLQRLVETHDSFLSVSVRQHLADKLKPLFSMLNKIEGVSKSDALLKQGGELEYKKPKQKPFKPIDEVEQKPKPKPNTKD